MSENQPESQEQPEPEFTLTYTDFNALREDVESEHKAARRHRGVATFCGAVSVGGFFLLGDALINHERANNMGPAFIAQALAAFGLMNQLDEARKRQRRAAKLDDAILKALDKSQGNLAAEELPGASNPASYDIYGQMATENVVVTVVHLEEILHAQGIDISTLRQLAPASDPPPQPEGSPPSPSS